MLSAAAQTRSTLSAAVLDASLATFLTCFQIYRSFAGRPICQSSHCSEVAASLHAVQHGGGYRAQRDSTRFCAQAQMTVFSVVRTNQTGTEEGSKKWRCAKHRKVPSISGTEREVSEVLQERRLSSDDNYYNYYNYYSHYRHVSN
jgi:hypothetical protein